MKIQYGNNAIVIDSVKLWETVSEEDKIELIGELMDSLELTVSIERVKDMAKEEVR